MGAPGPALTFQMVIQVSLSDAAKLAVMPIIAMVKTNKYSRSPDNPAKSSRARANNVRVHFKNTVETAAAIKGMRLGRAKRYLKAVIRQKECIPFRIFKGGVGRTSQAKQFKTSQGRWPKKSCISILKVLGDAENAAEMKGLNLKALRITHAQVSPAPKHRRRTYRAHGRINPFLSHPCHIQLILTEKEKPIKPARENRRTKKARKAAGETSNVTSNTTEKMKRALRRRGIKKNSTSSVRDVIRE